jgi:hypothetical protein
LIYVGMLRGWVKQNVRVSQQSTQGCTENMREFRISIDRSKCSHFIVIVEKEPVGNGTVDLANVSIAVIPKMGGKRTSRVHQA